VQIIPAIDIINGKCIRLTKGDYTDAAKSFEDNGFTRLHVVDLDGAKSRKIINLQTLESIALNTNLIIDFGGGIKDIADVSNVFNAGASIITLGSVAVKNPNIVKEWLIKFGTEKFLIGADVLNEKIKISGWLEDGGITIFNFIAQMIAIGVKNIFCTDISKDGFLQGPSIELYKKILQQFHSINLIASGGVSNIKEVKQLKEIGCTGAIIGKAIYEGKITLQELSNFN